MKAFARWLYIKCFNAELMQVAKYARDAVDMGKGIHEGMTTAQLAEGRYNNGRAMGALDTLSTLDLFV